MIPSLRHPNRIKIQAFKPGLYWCGGCDRQLVNDTKKCPVCGRRNGIKNKRRMKRSDSAKIKD